MLCTPWNSRSRQGPWEPLDAPYDLRKQALSQRALGQLESEVSGMPNEAPAGPEQPLLETRESSRSERLTDLHVELVVCGLVLPKEWWPQRDTIELAIIQVRDFIAH